MYPSTLRITNMKIALVYSFKESEWFSCTVIVRNLVEAYKKAVGAENVTSFHFGHNYIISEEDIRTMANGEFDRIVFIDHKPTPTAFLEMWKSQDKDYSLLPELIVHIFGDFPLYLREWRTFNQIMKSKKLKFICASERQKRYLSNYYHQDEIFYVSPFPVNVEAFSGEESKNTSLNIRKKYGLPDESKVFLYTGRLSYQKRIKEMVSLFCEYIQKNKIENEYLLIVGEFDNIGLPYLGYHQIHGEYTREVFRCLEKFPKAIQDKVLFTGKISNEEISHYYKQATFFVSLSTYHDEDYGMSVAEALCSGCPCILSDWAGFASFKNDKIKKATQFVPVQLGKSLPLISHDEFSRILDETKSYSVDREDISKRSAEKLSIQAVGVHLRGILNESGYDFMGGSSLMNQIISENYISSIQMFRREATREFNHFYFKVYDAYTK